jgi:hypothetical protein
LAERASRMLLDTFIRLLGGLIGAGLTQNILQVAWGSILPDAGSNDASRTDANDSISAQTHVQIDPDSDDHRGDP